MNKKILSAIVSLSLIAAIIVSCGIFNVFADNGAASSDAAVANGDSTVYPRAPITMRISSPSRVRNSLISAAKRSFSEAPMSAAG